MIVLVTGGAGFLGQRLIEALLAEGAVRLDGQRQPFERIVCADRVPGAIHAPQVDNRVADLGDPDECAALVDADTAVVVHLAAVVSGTAEADFDLGMRVNLDGTRHLLQACRAAGHAPRLLFSSSIAVFGAPLPAVLDDATAPRPQGSYGTQKLIGELLVADHSRRGHLDGRCVRVPTVVVRPGAPNGAASGFASAIVREPLAGREAVLPVDPDTRMWVASPSAVVGMLLRALDLPASAWGANRSLNLPGLSVSMREALDTLSRLAGAEVAARVRHAPDAAIERLVRTWPAAFDTARADAMGFRADADFGAILQTYLDGRAAAGGAAR